MGYTLGIDIGTFESKGVLADHQGRIVAQAARPHEMIVPRPGWAEHRADEDWWGDTVFLCRALLEQSKVAPQDMRSYSSWTCGIGVDYYWRSPPPEPPSPPAAPPAPDFWQTYDVTQDCSPYAEAGYQTPDPMPSGQGSVDACKESCDAQAADGATALACDSFVVVGGATCYYKVTPSDMRLASGSDFSCGGNGFYWRKYAALGLEPSRASGHQLGSFATHASGPSRRYRDSPPPLPPALPPWPAPPPQQLLDNAPACVLGPGLSHHIADGEVFLLCDSITVQGTLTVGNDVHLRTSFILVEEEGNVTIGTEAHPASNVSVYLTHDDCDHLVSDRMQWWGNAAAAACLERGTIEVRGVWSSHGKPRTAWSLVTAAATGVAAG